MMRLNGTVWPLGKSPLKTLEFLNFCIIYSVIFQGLCSDPQHLQGRIFCTLYIC